MVHYTCDLCGRSIEGQRFSVSIEIRRHEPDEPAFPADLDHDFLDQIENELLQLGSTADFQLPEPIKKTLHRDMCLPCTKRYEKDPLSREIVQRFNSSSN